MKRVSSVVLLLILVGCVSQSVSQQASQSSTVVVHSDFDVSYVVEVADTPKERETGLMSRGGLVPGHGMLFVYPQDQALSFWMKNTVFPIDILFINSTGSIVDAQYMLPCQRDPCQVYVSDKPAKWALEINGGETQKHRIFVGQKVEIIS